MKETVDVDFMDVQITGPLPEPVNKMVALITKAAMGTFLTYFAINELLVELKTYKANIAKGVKV